MKFRAVAILSLIAFIASTSKAAPVDIIDRTTLRGKVLCGYQGWFNAPGDGAKFNHFVHWGRGSMAPGTATVDLWPDVSELTPAEKFDTGFKFPDGRVAQVFSSYNAATVDRHFKWMHDYGIDGVFLQRFASGIGHADVMDHYDKVLANVRDGANHHGRIFAVMYDLSGTHDKDVDKIIGDWKHIVDDLRIPADQRYLCDAGKPLVALWGFGFNDGRDPLLDGGGMRLITFLTSDPKYGHNCVMLGVPTGWRTLDRDAVKDPRLLEVIDAADVVSPWTVGRFNSPGSMPAFAQKNWAPDLAWCNEHHKQYLPVVFPGFSWHNLTRGKSKVDQIPRLGGRFLWSQYTAATGVGATTVYQAMFDEVDEGTAIFKCTNEIPDGQGKSQFLTYDGLPSDFYLRLVGEASQLVRGEIKPADERLIKANDSQR